MLKINGVQWHIRFVPPDSSILMGTYGVTVPKHHTIYVADNLVGDRLRHVLAHEVSHAEFASRGLVVPVYVEEVLADIIADNILEVKENVDSLCNYYNKC